MTRREILQQTLNKLLSAQLSLSKEEFSILKKVGEFVIKRMNTTDLHGFPHVLRVLRLCLNLHELEGGNLFILILSTLLHDVGRDYTKKGERAQFLKAVYANEMVEVLDGQNSSMLRTFALANALVFLPETAVSIKTNDYVEVNLLPIN